VAQLTCPYEWCSNSGEIVGRGIYAECPSGAFERRGKVGGRAVFRCGECRFNFLVKAGFLGVRAYTLWSRP
jgi:hypothetical protein